MNDKIKIDDLPPEYQELVRKATETVMEKVKNGTPFALALFDPEIIKMATGEESLEGEP